MCSHLEVAIDLHQQLFGFCDAVGGHHLPLQDGQGNVRAGCHVHVFDWLESEGRSGQAVHSGRGLELRHLHARHRLWRQKHRDSEQLLGEVNKENTGTLPVTLFPNCCTWLVLVWLFTILNCFCRVSLARSSCKNKESQQVTNGKKNKINSRSNTHNI